MKLATLVRAIIVVVLVYACSTVWLSGATDPPLLQVGGTYMIAMGCFPKLGCHGEIHKVTSVRADGWFTSVICDPESMVCGGEPWQTNLATISAVQVLKSGRSAN